MAKFLRLHIRGIRSVGDEDHNVHKIEFLSPCTLINGPNGTGKTTTIEALNFVTTGQMPTKTKNSFIHSTDVARKTRIDASVALEFIDVKGRVCTAVRKLVATVGTKNNTAAEEHTLTIKYPDGTVTSLSSKVCDFNKAILHHLGVPKPIFKYVIFCHQEDSTWPLSEPKELKSRFDDIFQLTKFVKAQERMKKLANEFKSEKKTHEAHMKLYEAHIKEKVKAKQIRNECDKKITIGNQNLVERKQKKSEKIKKLEELKEQQTKLEDVLISLQKNEHELENLNKQLQLIRVEPFSGTEAELELEIEEAKMSSGSRNFKQEREMIERKIGKNNQERVELMRGKVEAEKKISGLKAESIHCTSLQTEMKELESSLRSDLSIDPEAFFSQEIITAIQKRIQQLTNSTREMASDSAECQKELQSAQESVTKIEVELKSLLGEKQKLEKEVIELQHKIRQGQSANSGMKDLLKKEEMIRKELESIPEIDEAALLQNKRRREIVQKELDDLRKQCSEAEKNAEKEKEMEALKQSLTVARKKLTAYERKHQKNWAELFGEAPPAPWTGKVSKLCGELRNQKRNLEFEIREVQLKVQKIETTQQQNDKYEMKLTDQELQIDESIFDNCSCSPDEVAGKLAELNKKLQKARKELAPISAKADLYETFIESSNSSGCCPLCDRDFSTKKDIADFSKRLQNLTLSLPAEQEGLEKTVQSLEEQKINLVKAEGQVAEIQKIQKELKEIRDKKKSTARELMVEQKALEKKEAVLEELNEKVKRMEELQTDVGVMDGVWEQIQEGQRKEHGLKMDSDSDEAPGLSYAELREKTEKKDLEFRELVLSSEDLQKSTSERNRLQSKLNELGSHRVSLGEAAAQTGAFAEQLEKKKEEIGKCLQKERRMREEDLPDAKFKKEELMSQAGRQEEKWKRAEMAMQMKRKEFEQKHQHWKQLFGKVEDGQKMSHQLADREEHLDLINSQLEENQQRQKRFEEDLRQLNGTQSKQSVLEDQRQRMKIEKKIRHVETVIQKLKDSAVSEEQIVEVRREASEVQNYLRSVAAEEIKIDTQVKEYQKQMNEAEERLATKEARNAEINYRDAILEVALCEETMADLVKYNQCLDDSLISFHAEKMSAVNVIIDELWRKVYNSTDITTIRIRSEPKSESSTTKNTSYDYNVMMVQESGVEVEMRGRCSAGQKMLASLLIRIALAEVFGGLCSMIALDEPTTNLDESKVEGMANVLNDLIEARRGYDRDGNLKGREMQMVVITHDERLVNKLTLGCRPEYIYCLGKNEHGVSYLTKRYYDGSEVRVTGKRTG